MLKTTYPVLSKNQIDEFFSKGWIALPNLFTQSEVDKIKACYSELEAAADKIKTTQMYEGSYFVLGEDKNAGTIIKRVVWAGGFQSYLLEIGSDQRILRPVSQLLDSNSFDHLLNQAHFKRPGDKVIFDWHQDIQHRDKGPGTWTDINGRGSYVQTALTIDPMTKDNGPLLFMPGSSTWGKVDFGDHEDYDYDKESFALNMPEKFDPKKAEVITAPAGSVLFFGPYTAHASFENTTAQSRRILINGYAYPGANHRIYPGSEKGRKLKLPAHD